MKTQSLALFVWNSWKGKPASPIRPVPGSHRLLSSATASSSLTTRKSEPEKKNKNTSGKLTKSDQRDLISSTQSLDACFSTMWRRAT
jgi:hypothetical protein